MKLTSFQLEAQLGKKLGPVYLISGDELMLKQDAASMVRKAAKAAGFVERVRVSPEAGYDWEQLHTLLYSNSLFAENRLLELDFRDSLPPKAASQLLQNYADNPSPNIVILVDLCKVDEKIARSAWYKALDKIGFTVAIWPLSREQMPQWIIQRAKKYKLQISLDAANVIADYAEGNMLAAAQTIEKIYLLRPTDTINAELIHQIIVDESHFTVFDFVESLLAGKRERALQIITNLKTEGIEPILVLWSITRELRLLCEFADELARGARHDELFQKHRIFAKRQSAIRHFLSRRNSKDCQHILSHCAEVDKLIKGAVPGNAWDALQLMTLRLT